LAHDGVYKLGQGGVLLDRIFLLKSLGAAYIPISLDRKISTLCLAVNAMPGPIRKALPCTSAYSSPSWRRHEGGAPAMCRGQPLRIP
jgi:hypothetical protein